MKKPTDTAVRDRVTFAIFRITRLLRTRTGQHTALPASDWRLLALLFESARMGIRLQTQAELGAELSLSPSAFTRLVDRMIRKGFVRRLPGVSRRANAIEVTPRGSAEWRSMRRHVDVELAGMFAGLSARDVRTLDRVLAQMRAHLETTVHGDHRP
jgi:DNA-binding MarR family transcriptional regulator